MGGGITISWTPYGKVRQVTKEDGTYVAYKYDASGNRVEKEVVAGDENHITNYVRDASGNVIAVYNDTDEEDYIDFHIYGSSRIGQYKGIKQPGKLKVGLRQYELTNHLGNVLAVINDKPEATAEGVTANVLSTNDYYPFGLTMAGRTFSSEEYRYGFNGKEKDGSFGDTNYDYGFRIYNPRIAKFLSVDPLTSSYPELTPYQFASNTPIMAIDLDGLEAYYFNLIRNDGNLILELTDYKETGTMPHFFGLWEEEFDYPFCIKVNFEGQEYDFRSNASFERFLSNPDHDQYISKEEAERDIETIQLIQLMKEMGLGRSKPKRPSWQQSEKDALKGTNYKKQKSFKNGIEVKYGTEGSVRPEGYKSGESLEVKNYDISTSGKRSNLVRNIVQQINKRIVNLPANTKQNIVIDVRGQKVQANILNDIKTKIHARSNTSNINVMFKVK